MITHVLVLLFGLLAFLAGMMTLLGYILYRMMKNKGWDDSNITNAIRLLSHVALHPQDFGRMYYVSSSGEINMQRPFWYVSKDELSEVVGTRP